MWFSRRRTAFGDADSGSDSLEALIRQADTARDDGEAEQAAALYAEAVARAPDRNDLKMQLGNMLKDVGRLRDADAIYQQIQDADPDDADVCVQRGHVRKLLGDRHGARAQYRKAVTISPDSFGAAEELAEVGSALHQQQRFEVNFRTRGSEAILTLSRQIAEMRTVLDGMAARLPEALGHAAIPVESYGVFAELFPAPAPPPGRRLPVTVLLPAEGVLAEVLDIQLGALRAQAFAGWTALVVGAKEPAARHVVERAAATDPRFRAVPLAAGDMVAAAEWRAARTVSEGVLLFAGPGTQLHPQATAWAAALPDLSAATAFVCDEDHVALRRGGAAYDRPMLRPVVDYDTLLEANVFGETVAVTADAFGRLLGAPPEGGVGRARSRLLLELARSRTVAHVPYVLGSRLDEGRPSLPEHREAVAAHAEVHGFADRIRIAKGESGPTLWRAPEAPDGLTVVIPTRDNAHDLRLFVQSLRSLAARPDHLRFVVVENNASLPETRAILDELGAKRYLTLLADPTPFNWSRLCNIGARAADTSLLLFANDDMLMQTEGWDDRLRGLLARDEVGAVGARLLYPDNTLQHAGILFDWKGGTIHDGLYASAEEPGPARRYQVTRATGAVTGAFLATRRDRFAALGGFDEARLPIEYGDVDFCLKMRQQGHRVLWTPGITLRHDESKSRGMDHLMPGRLDRFTAEQAVLAARWGEALDREPGVSPVWADATTPFRLLLAPSQARALAHVRLTGQADPWAVDTPAVPQH